MMPPGSSSPGLTKPRCPIGSSLAGWRQAGQQAVAARRRRGGQPALHHRVGCRAHASSEVAITGTGIATLTAGHAPSSLSAAVAERLGFVSGPVRKVLRAAALLGVDFVVTDLAIILDRSAADLTRALHEACVVGVLAECWSTEITPSS